MCLGLRLQDACKDPEALIVPADGFLVHHYYVGDGNCSLVARQESPDVYDVLVIDGGQFLPVALIPHLTWLASEGRVSTLSLIVTHTDADHIDGLSALLLLKCDKSPVKDRLPAIHKVYINHKLILNHKLKNGWLRLDQDYGRSFLGGDVFSGLTRRVTGSYPSPLVAGYTVFPLRISFLLLPPHLVLLCCRSTGFLSALCTIRRWISSPQNSLTRASKPMSNPSPWVFLVLR